MLLAIDTATRILALALHDGEMLVGEQMWHTANRHNTLLAPSVQQMLDVCDVAMDDLTAIAVTMGPGSYTGLRIGVAFAKGIAAAKNLPLIGVSTLDMIAAGQVFQNTSHRLLTIIPAGRSRIIAGEYRAKKGRWEAIREAEISTWDELLAKCEGSYYVAGEVDEKGREALTVAQENGLSVILVDAARRSRRAGFLAQEAWQRYHAGEAEDFSPAKLVPIYLKPAG
jgi:tRNA threonylcarbamoyladenosine biosynthesis protein TsaB